MYIESTRFNKCHRTIDAYPIYIKWKKAMLINVHVSAVAADAKSLQSYQTLCDPIDGSPPGSPIPGILKARTLEWAAISFSNA